MLNYSLTHRAHPTVKAPYWKFAHSIEKLSLRIRPVRNEKAWGDDEVRRWSDYDDSFSGLGAFCEQWLQREQDAAKAAGRPALSEEQRVKRLVQLTLSERQAVIAYKTLLAACHGGLCSLTVEPPWILWVPQLVSSLTSQVLSLVFDCLVHFERCSDASLG